MTAPFVIARSASDEAISMPRAPRRARPSARQPPAGTLAAIASPDISWHPVAAGELAGWDARLLATEASFLQYPYWNESMTSWRLRSSYLSCGPPDDPVAFVSVLALGFGRRRVGLLREGPVWLRDLDEPTTAACLESLVVELRERGFVLACFTSLEADALARIAALAPSNRDRLFAFPIAEPESLVVPQAASDEETASRFAPVARRDIRKAERAGFVVESADSDEALRVAWPIWMQVHRFRSLYGRSRASWRRLLERARALRTVRIYTASIDARPVQSILVVRAGSRATYVIGALDREALGGLPSPSCLLHFRAMRDAFAGGCTLYDFGSRSGPVHRFKSKFRPDERILPTPVNLILEPTMYPLVSWLLPRLR